jgi:hypothetical protein
MQQFSIKLQKRGALEESEEGLKVDEQYLISSAYLLQPNTNVLLDRLL